VPASFRLIVGALYLSGKTDLALAHLEDAGGEFYAVLSRDVKTEPFDMGRLLVEAQREERQVVL
jgi:hypothetical protein